jgi:hypothetical protein
MEIDSLNSTTRTSESSISELGTEISENDKSTSSTSSSQPKTTEKARNALKDLTFFSEALLNLDWDKESTVDNYLTKINSYNCEYFNINTYNEVAHSTINIKQRLDIRPKIKEQIDLQSMFKAHKKELHAFNANINHKEINPHITHAEQYNRYLDTLDKSTKSRYAIKKQIEIEDELESRKLIKYEWQFILQEEIDIYYEHH